MSEINTPASQQSLVNGTNHNENTSLSIANEHFGSGGGALTSISDSTRVDEFSGSASFEFPLHLSQSRSDSPTLSLNYSSGSGHTPFGLGMNLSVPMISHRTQGVNVPNYDDDDILIYNNSDYLVPVIENNLKLERTETINQIEYLVTAYRSRTIESHLKIERFRNNDNHNDTFWRIITEENTTLIFGYQTKAKIYNPQKTEQVFTWLLQEVIDSKGNHQKYEYTEEDNNDGMIKNDADEKGHIHAVNKYLSKICYGNKNHPSQSPYLFAENTPPVEWMFEVHLDYGQYDTSLTNSNQHIVPENRYWAQRSDKHSTYSSGFEIRTRRLCKNILLFHSLPFGLEKEQPVLVKRWQLDYQQSNIISLLSSITEIGVIYQSGNETTPYRQEIMPPVELEYQQFEQQDGEFKKLELGNTGLNLEGVNDKYQVIDIFQEGIPSIVYRENSWMYYRKPETVTKENDQYQISYGPLQKFPELPNQGHDPSKYLLANFTRQGKVQLVNTAPGTAGFYSVNNDGQWDGFVPFDAFPTEFLHPSATFADLTGEGIPDLVMIGPSSVRFYSSELNKGFSVAKEVQDLPECFPTSIHGNGIFSLGFSDLLGTGQQHLFKISHNTIEVWPNLGNGRFGDKIQLENAPNFDSNTFNPSNIFLADLNGSGCSDLIYVDQGRLQIFLNRSGQGFNAPFFIDLPKSYDRLDQISFSDIYGIGSASLIFTVTHPTLEHYVYDFTQGKKPYLLKNINNNKGYNSELTYGSSAHDYLEDKRNGRVTQKVLPLAVQVIKKLVHHDEVNNVSLAQTYQYSDGFYDFEEREYRGFGKVTKREIETFSGKSPSEPLCAINWYHTGDQDLDAITQENDKDVLIRRKEYFQYASKIADIKPNLVELNPDIQGKLSQKIKRDAFRALKGKLMRTELYGIEDNQCKEVPFHASEYRYKIQCLQLPSSTTNNYAIVQPLTIEEVTYLYEEKEDDPRISHKIVKQFDTYGFETETFAINYPRTKSGLFQSIEQRKLHVQKFEKSYIHQVTQDDHLLALEFETKHLKVESVQLPNNSMKFSYEFFNNFELTTSNTELIAFSKAIYTDQNNVLPEGIASAQGLLSHKESAAYHQGSLESLLVNQDKVLTIDELNALIFEDGKYHSVPNSPYIWSKGERVEYADKDNFYLPIKQIDPFDNTTQIDYDNNKLKVFSVTDALGNTTSVSWNYRVLSPYKVTDANNNLKTIQYDGFGRTLRSSISGTENGQQSGFKQLTIEAPILEADTLISNPKKAIDGAAQVEAILDRSWMGHVSSELLSSVSGVSLEQAQKLVVHLTKKGWLTPYGNLTHRARKALSKMNKLTVSIEPALTLKQVQDVTNLLNKIKRSPVNKIAVSAETYYIGNEKSTNQYRTSLQYLDGFNRVLQNKAKVEAGMSFICNQLGELNEENGKPIKKEVTERWLTSGRTIFNNKGLPIQVFEPYYLNTANFVENEKLKRFGLSSTLQYDALGRVISKVSAKGFLTKDEYSPWYQRHFDENDTLTESPYYLANFVNNPDVNSKYHDAVIYANRNETTTSDDNVEIRRAIDERVAIERSLQHVDTPTTQLFDALGNTVVNEKLDSILIEEDRFTSLGLSSANMQALFNYFRTEKIITQANTLSSSFDGDLKKLPELLHPMKVSIESILTTLHNSRKQTNSSQYDTLGRVLTMTDGRLTAGANIVNTYNLSELVKTESVDAGTVWKMPNALGSTIYQRDSKGVVLRFGYDQLNRKISLAEQIGTKLHTRELHEFVNTKALTPQQKLMFQSKNLIGQLQYVYDQSGRTEFESLSLTGQALTKHTRFTKKYETAVAWPTVVSERLTLLEQTEYTQNIKFNARNQILESTDPKGSIKTYTYFPSGLVSAIQHKQTGRQTQQLVDDVVYAANGLVLSESNLGVKSTYQYEKSTLRLVRSLSRKESNDNIIKDQRYTYDPIGNVMLTRESATLANFTHEAGSSPLKQYYYDSLNRLIKVTGRKQKGLHTDKTLPTALSLKQNAHALVKYTQTFNYDLGNNLLQKQLTSDTNSTISFSVDSMSNKSMMTSGSGSFKELFDANGNQLSRASNVNTLDLVWDFKNQLSQCILLKRSDNRDDIEHYVYNSQGERTRKITEKLIANQSKINIEEVRYLDDLEIRIRGHRNLDEDNTSIVKNEELTVYKLSHQLSEVHLLSWSIGLPKGQINNEYRTRLLDRQKSTSLEVNQQGEIISFEEYYAFGGTAITATRDQIEVSLKNYRFNGKERDANTGLYYYGLRYYAPWQCRWLRPDPAGIVDGLNVYAFVENNPATLYDPNGLEDEDPELSEAEAIEQATTLIRDIVSLYLNVNEDNAKETKDGVLKSYTALKNLVDSKKFSANQLGNAFKTVANEVYAAGKDASQSQQFDLTKAGSPTKNRNTFGAVFDQKRTDINTNSNSSGIGNSNGSDTGNSLEAFTAVTGSSGASIAEETSQPSISAGESLTSQNDSSSNELTRSASVSSTHSSVQELLETPNAQSIALQETLSSEAVTQEIITESPSALTNGDSITPESTQTIGNQRAQQDFANLNAPTLAQRIEALRVASSGGIR